MTLLIGQTRVRAGAVASKTVLVLLAALWLLPLLWVVSSSLKPENEIVAFTIEWIPSSPTLSHYGDALVNTLIGRWIYNSVLVSVLVTLGILLTQSLAAFAISKVPFPGSMVVFLFLVAGIMVPPQVLVIPLYTLFNSMQLVDSYPAIILPQLALPLGLFIFKQFFDGIPRDMQEVAALDGAGNLRIYASIVLPMSRPVMTAVGIFHFILSWNYFFWPLIIESSEKMYTLPVGLATFQGTRGMEYGLLMAGVIVASIPVLIGYIVFQDQLVKGVTLQQK